MYNSCKNCNALYKNTNIKKYEKTKTISNDDDKKCACGFENDPTVFPENYMYGQSYVPIQYIDQIFKPEIGLKMGTIFPELVSPYAPGQNMEEMKFLMERTRREG